METNKKICVRVKQNLASPDTSGACRKSRTPVVKWASAGRNSLQTPTKRTCASSPDTSLRLGVAGKPPSCLRFWEEGTDDAERGGEDGDKDVSMEDNEGEGGDEHEEIEDDEQKVEAEEEAEVDEQEEEEEEEEAEEAAEAP